MTKCPHLLKFPHLRKIMSFPPIISVHRFAVQPEAPPQPTYQTQTPVLKCPKCKNHDMVLRTRKENKGFFMPCLGKPTCDNVIWLADVIKEITPTETPCRRCGNASRIVTIRFKSATYLGLLFGDRINDDGSYNSCLLCDQNLRNVLDIRDVHTRPAHSTSSNNSNNAAQSNDWARPTHPAPVNRNQSANNRNSTSSAAGNTSRSANNSFGTDSSRANTSRGNQSFGGDENVKCQICNQPATK